MFRFNFSNFSSFQSCFLSITNLLTSYSKSWAHSPFLTVCIEYSLRLHFLGQYQGYSRTHKSYSADSLNNSYEIKIDFKAWEINIALYQKHPGYETLSNTVIDNFKEHPNNSRWPKPQYTDLVPSPNPITAKPNTKPPPPPDWWWCMPDMHLFQTVRLLINTTSGQPDASFFIIHPWPSIHLHGSEKWLTSDVAKCLIVINICCWGLWGLEDWELFRRIGRNEEAFQCCRWSEGRAVEGLMNDDFEGVWMREFLLLLVRIYSHRKKCCRLSRFFWKSVKFSFHITLESLISNTKRKFSESNNMSNHP